MYLYVIYLQVQYVSAGSTVGLECRIQVRTHTVQSWNDKDKEKDKDKDKDKDKHKEKEKDKYKDKDKHKHKGKEKDKDKVHRRPNICYIFETQAVQGYQL